MVPTKINDRHIIHKVDYKYRNSKVFFFKKKKKQRMGNLYVNPFTAKFVIPHIALVTKQKE